MEGQQVVGDIAYPVDEQNDETLNHGGEAKVSFLRGQRDRKSQEYEDKSGDRQRETSVKIDEKLQIAMVTTFGFEFLDISSQCPNIQRCGGREYRLAMHADIRLDIEPVIFERS